MSRKGDAVQLLEMDILALQLPQPEREYRFDAKRKWRFDFAWPDHKAALEVDGGTWSGGRHTSGAGYERDAYKLNAAALAGWKVLRFTTTMIREGAASEALPLLLEHAWCHTDFHRCDGGGPGEYQRYIDGKCGI